jgi:hypothetical protein
MMHVQRDSDPLLRLHKHMGDELSGGGATARSLKQMVHLLTALVVLNMLVMTGLIYLGVQYIQSGGLRDTFYDLHDDFHDVHSTIVALNGSITELNDILTAAVNNVLPNVFEMCYQVSLHTTSKCKSWP